MDFVCALGLLEPTARKRSEHLGLEYMSALCHLMVPDALADAISCHHNLNGGWPFPCGIPLLLGLTKVLVRANTKW